MDSRVRIAARIGLVAGALVASMAFASVAAAHAELDVPGYEVEIGWINEPTFAGQPNGFEVFVNKDGKPVTDLGDDALKLVVSTAGQDTPSLALTPAFSVEEGWGTPGRYTTSLVPTVPGEYKVHLTGSIHGTAVDATATSGEGTFDSVTAASDIEFPVKNPSLVDVGTRLDRIDGRIQEIQSSVPSAQTLADLQAAATSAKDAAASAKDAADKANQSATLGVATGIAGLVVAVIAIWLGWRAGRRSARTA